MAGALACRLAGRQAPLSTVSRDESPEEEGGAAVVESPGIVITAAIVSIAIARADGVYSTAARTARKSYVERVCNRGDGGSLLSAELEKRGSGFLRKNDGGGLRSM